MSLVSFALRGFLKENKPSYPTLLKKSKISLKAKRKVKMLRKRKAYWRMLSNTLLVKSRNMNQINQQNDKYIKLDLGEKGWWYDTSTNPEIIPFTSTPKKLEFDWSSKM